MSRPVHWLRLEGLAALAASITLFAAYSDGWMLLPLLFLAPDLSMIGYAAGSRVGAISYNLFHTYTVPLSLLGAGWVLDHDLLRIVALVWIAHIGFDRMLGYGLKSPSGFHDTHLGRIGRRPLAVTEEG